MPAPRVDRISLEGIALEGIVGDLPHERDRVQRIEIDLVIEVDLTDASKSDELADTVDYRWVYDTAARLVEETRETRPHLLETLLGRIADALLGAEKITGVTVRGRKPEATLAGPTRTIEVEIRRARSVEA